MTLARLDKLAVRLTEQVLAKSERLVRGTWRDISAPVRGDADHGG